MKRVLLFVALLPNFAFCALAPLAQSVREISAILSYPNLEDQLVPSSAIEDIKKVDEGYLIITKSQVLKVKVVYESQKRIGAKKFTLQFAAPMPLHSSDCGCSP